MFTVTSMLDLLSFFQRFGHLFPHPCSCEWQRRFFGKRYFGREHISTMIWLNMITLIHQPRIFPQMRKFPMFCSDVTRMCWTPGWKFSSADFRRFFFPVCDYRGSQALLSPEVALWTWRALRWFWFKKHPLTSPNKRINKISCLQAFHLPCEVWEWGFWVYEFTNWIWVWWVQLTKTICLMYILGEDGQNSENCGWNNWILLDLLVPWNDSREYWNPDFFHHLWRDSPSSPAFARE